jgi:hypothetical protein
MIGQGISALSEKQQGDDAADALRADAALKAAQIRKLAVRTRGEARAAIAASGLDVNSASAKIIDSTIAGESEQDVMNTIMSGARGADVAKTAGQTNALGTVVGALGSSYGQSAMTSIGRWKTASGSGVGASSAPPGYS